MPRTNAEQKIAEEKERVLTLARAILRQHPILGPMYRRGAFSFTDIKAKGKKPYVFVGPNETYNFMQKKSLGEWSTGERRKFFTACGEGAITVETCNIDNSTSEYQGFGWNNSHDDDVEEHLSGEETGTEEDETDINEDVPWPRVRRASPARPAQKRPRSQGTESSQKSHTLSHRDKSVRAAQLVDLTAMSEESKAPYSDTRYRQPTHEQHAISKDDSELIAIESVEQAEIFYDEDSQDELVELAKSQIGLWTAVLADQYAKRSQSLKEAEQRERLTRRYESETKRRRGQARSSLEMMLKSLEREKEG